MLNKESSAVLRKSAKHRSALNINQQGMAAILVTTVLITVIGLIVIGFSLTVRRNQRETLDRQLSTQAFYAAESGVNAARAKAAEMLRHGQPIAEQTDCGLSTPTYAAPDLSGGGSANVSVTCLEVSNKLETLDYQDVGSGRDVFVPIVPPDGVTVDRIKLSWTPSAAMSNLSGCNSINLKDFPKANGSGGWVNGCKYGLIRADVVKNITGTDELARTLFLKPHSGGPSSIPLNYGITGKVEHARCDTGKCEVYISVNGSVNYYLRIRSLYLNAPTLKVGAVDAGGHNIMLGGQIAIDSTGKAQDVLRRISVRVEVVPGSDTLPLGAIESTGDVCKRFATWPSGFKGGSASNPYCKD